MPSWILPLLTVTIVFLIVIPVWPHSKGWTWAPAGMIGMIGAIILLATVATKMGVA